MILALHLGLHKTGTSHLQAALRLNAAALGAAGVAAPPLTEVRREATARLGREPEAARAWLARLAGSGARRVVISDENLPGGLAGYAKGGPIHPALARRLAPFAAWPGEIEVFLAVRSYEEFWPAIWLESLLHRAAGPWAAFAAGIDAERARWPDLVARLVGLFGEARVTVWDHADYRETWRLRFARLTGGAAALRAPPTDVRPSHSTAAAAELDRLAAEAPGAVRARFLALRAAPPPGPPFRPWPEAEARALAARHSADMAAISARFPRLGR